MRKLIKTFGCLFLLAGYCNTLAAQEMAPETEKPVNEQTVNEDERIDWYPELIMRPVGFTATVFGTALFVACSPFSGLATIAEPHDAIEKTYNAFMVTPYRYTFERPLGVYDLTIDADKDVGAEMQVAAED